MYFTGFADEAGASIDVQIKATKELGWENIESRNIDGINIHDLSDEKFDEVYDKLKESGVKINCFGSAIANWQKHIGSEDDFKASIEELKRALPRMERLGTKMVRAMSFAVPNDKRYDNPYVEKIVFERVNYLAKMCEDAGVYYMHENCMNYGGQSAQHTLKLIDNIKSDAFKILFDTGNPPFQWDRRNDNPAVKQNAWEYYQNIKEFIEYIHIKDCYVNEEDKHIFTYPGEGDGHVKEIVTDLIKSGYDGGFSIEPHLVHVFHEENKGETQEEYMFNTYVEYGKRMMKIVDDIKKF